MAPPANDNFANAQGPLSTSLPASATGTTFDATKEGTEPAFATNDQSVWFYFIPASTGWYKFWIDPADITFHNGQSLGIVIGTPTTLAGYTTSAVETYAVHPDGQFFTGFMTVAMFLTASTTYYIKVYSNRPSGANAQSVDFTLRWDAFTPPSNNNFASPTAVGSLPASLAVNTKDSTMEASEPLISPGFYTGIQSRWYTFTAAAAGLYRVTLVDADFTHTGTHLHGTIGGIPQTPGLIYAQVFKDFVDTLAETTEANALAVNSMSEGTSGDIVLSFVVPSAGTYYIRISTPYKLKAGVSDGETYSWNDQAVSTTMQVAAAASPGNDNFASATVLSTTVPNSLTAQTTFDSSQEASEADVFSSGSNIEQSVWYKFTPTVTGAYIFKLPLASATYHGTAGASSGELNIGIWHQTTLAGITTANMITSDVMYTDPAWTTPHDAAIIVSLTAGEVYYIKVASGFGTTYNRSSCDFTITWDAVPAITNDDFANATAISGASGSVSPVHTATSTFQTGASEPPSYYWNDPQTQGTIWYDWTCPATGDYVFKIEATEDSTGTIQPTFDLAIWQGSSVGSLTKIRRSFIGSQNVEGRPWSPATAVGFHAISGQHYKIQITNWSPVYNDSKLTWRTNTVTGDSTTAPASMPNGRTDNYGNDNSEPPPNFATILAGHDSWWFTDGQVGGVKWFKAVYADTQTITISGQQFAGYNDGAVTNSFVGDIGLIVYKGTSYGSLTVPKIKSTTVDAAMMMSSGFFNGVGTSHARLVSLNTPGASDGEKDMQVDVTAGDTVWVCIFGLYDNNITNADELDATQFELDLFIPAAVPGNDVWSTVYSSSGYQYNLSRDLYDDGFAVGPEAGTRAGTTIGATASVGEGARAGFAATRSVWYKMFLDDDDTRTWEFSVSSAVDCVLGIYEIVAGGALGALLASDDDSGTGDTPLINYVPNDHTVFGNGYAIVVDSKTEGSFTLNYRRLNPATPPGNDNFANATVIGAIPYSGSGTTVGATAEFDEHTAQELGSGPKDSVWYKYVATFNGRLKIKARCTSAFDDAYVYVDTWRGTTLAGLVRDPTPPPTGPGGGVNRGFFNYFATPAQNEGAAINLDIVSGQTYYIRVQTESGGSETFDIQTEVDATYIDIQPSGSDEMHGTLIDSATVLVDIQVSAIELYSVTTDAATVLVDIRASSTNELMAHEYTDVGTVYYNIGVDSHDCQTTWDPTQLTAYGRRRYETHTNGRWNGTRGFRRWEAIGGDGLEEC